MIVLDFVAIAALCVSTSATSTIDAPQEVISRYELAGKTREIGRDDVALYLAKRHRNSKLGEQTREHLIECELVRQAAAAANVMPTRAEMESELLRVEKSLEGEKIKLDQVLAKQRMTRSIFTEKLALGIAKTRLVAKELGLSDASKVSKQDLALWTTQQRSTAKIITEPGKLPSGVRALVGKGEVTQMAIGRVLLIERPAAEVRNAVNEMIWCQCIEHEAEKNGIEVSSEDVERVYQKNKRAFEKDKKHRGVSFEQFLQARGSSKAQELSSPFRKLALQHEKLVRKLYPQTTIDEALKTGREAVLRRHGARRNLSVILIRALEEPNKFIKRDFADAKKYADLVRKQIADENRSFSLMAKTCSDDPNSKLAGGVIGWQHREYAKGSTGQLLPDAVLEVAFRLSISSLSAPIRCADGYRLVWISGVEPPPTEKRIRARLLGEMSDRYKMRLYVDAKIVHLFQ